MKLEKSFAKQKLLLTVDLLTKEELQIQLKEIIEAYFAQQHFLETMMAKQLGIE